MKQELSLILRLSLIILILLIPINIFQELLQNITLKVIVFFLELSKASPIVGKYSVKNSIEIFGTTTVDIVKYCVTSSAYYLLTILTIITKGIHIIKRISMFLIGAFLIFLMNITRIMVLIVILLKQGSEAFEFAHTTFFMALSIIYVIIIWFIMSLIFKVDTIPIYSDIKDLLKNE
jgi:exosortase/archaeosortase family protein